MTRAFVDEIPHVAAELAKRDDEGVLREPVHHDVVRTLENERWNPVWGEARSILLHHGVDLRVRQLERPGPERLEEADPKELGRLLRIVALYAADALPRRVVGERLGPLGREDARRVEALVTVDRSVRLDDHRRDRGVLEEERVDRRRRPVPDDRVELETLGEEVVAVGRGEGGVTALRVTCCDTGEEREPAIKKSVHMAIVTSTIRRASLSAWKYGWMRFQSSKPM